MNSLGNILQIICEHLHDLYTLNSFSLKGTDKIPRDSFNSSLYILFSMFVNHREYSTGGGAIWPKN